MRFLKHRQAIIVADHPWATGDGVCLYVSPAGVDDRLAVVYRKLRMFGAGESLVASSFPALGDGPLGLDAHVAIADAGDPLSWTLPAEYQDAVFWCNVRPHRNGLEYDTFAGAQRVAVDAEGEPLPSLAGGRIISATKLDAGGARVWFAYVPSLTSDDPVSFRVDADNGLTIDAAAEIDFSSQAGDYRVDLSGLDDAVEYTLRLIAISGTTETELDTLTFTADSAGPDASTLTITEA